MSIIEILKNDQITVYFHEEDKIIHHVCHKQISGQPYRDAFFAGTDTLIKYKAIKWLSDDRMNPMVCPDDQKWLAEVWTPKILQAGWKYWGLVMPQEALGQMRMTLACQIYSKLGVTLNTFEDPIKALVWLKMIA